MRKIAVEQFRMLQQATPTVVSMACNDDVNYDITNEFTTSMKNARPKISRTLSSSTLTTEFACRRNRQNSTDNDTISDAILIEND
jgi:hypothetical protein